MKRVFTKVFFGVLLTFSVCAFALTAQAQTFTEAVATGGTNQHATAMTTDKFGNVWVIVNPTNAANAKLVEYVGGSGSPVAITSSIEDDDPTNNNGAYGLASDSQGNIYASTANGVTNGLILKFTYPSYTQSTLVTGSAEIGYFNTIAVGPDDMLYAVQYNANGNTQNAGVGDVEVARYPTTSATVNDATHGGTPLYTDLEDNFFLGIKNNPSSYDAVTTIGGLAVDASLNIYVADGFDDNQLPTNSNGQHIYKLLKPSSGNNYTLGSTVESNLHAISLAMNTARTNLYATVSLTFNNIYSVVEYVGGTGSPVTLYTEPSNPGFYPYGLAYVSDSELFFNNGGVSSSDYGDIEVIYGIPAAASLVNFTSTTEKTTTVNWTNGGGSSRAVFAALSTAGSISLTNGTTYSASTTFGSGTGAGTGWNCIYNGTGNSVGISGLTANTGYKVMVIEYNGVAGAQNYATGTGTNNPNTFTTPANPSLTASGGNDSYNVGGSAVAVDAGITATAGQTNLSTATISVSTNYSSGDALNFTNQNGITGSLSGSTLTLSGSATVANYQTALQSITFSSSSVSPATRTVSFLVGDGTANSNTVTKNITVSAGTTITSIAAASSITNASTTTFNVVFAGSITGLGTSNFGVATTGTVGGASVASVSGSGTTYTVTVNTGTGDGTIGLNLNNSTGLTPLVTDVPFTGGTIIIDKTAPTISIGAPSLSATNTGPVTYTVTYADANFNSSTLANGNITLNTTGSATGSVNVTGSGLTRTVTISGITGDGTLGISIAAGTASDLAGNTAPASSASTTFNVDNTAPTISIGAPSLTLTNTGPVTYTVTYADANFNSSTLANGNITLNTTGGATGTVGVTGSGLTRTVTISGITGSGTLGISIGSGTATDLAGNAAPAAGPSTTFSVDNTAPSVSSINIASANPTNATSVDYTVTFSEAVTGVDASDFTVTTTSGSATGSVTGVTGSGTTYTVTIGSVSGNGALRLDLNSSGTGIFDVAANPIATGFTTGQAYTIDNTPATLISGSYFSNNGFSSQYAKVGDNLTLSVGYNEVLQSLTMTIGGNPVSVTPSNGNQKWTGVYTMTSGDTEGNVGWTLSATDLAGNVRNYSNNDFGTVLIFDKTPPTPVIGAPTPAITGNGAGNPVTYAVTYNDANFNFSTLSTSDITLNTTGTATGTIGLSGSGTSYTVTISNITGFGTIGISIGAGTAQDIPGNVALASAPSATFDVVSTDATLSALTTDLRKVAPNFSPAVLTGYTTHVPYSATTTAVIATPVQAAATVQVQVNGGGYVAAPNGKVSPALSLNPGDNTIDVLVTAPDLVSTKSYSITTTRAHSSLLSTLSYSPPSLRKTKVSGPDYVDYTATVDPTVTSVSVTPVAEDPTSVITVNGVTVASGDTSSPITLTTGQTTINTVVTTIDGLSTKTYSIVVTKQADALLTSLTYNPGLTAHKATGTHDFDYTATIYSSSVKVTPVAEDPAASITVNGTPVASGSESGAIALALGDNTITTVVTATDGVTTKTYSMVVTRQANALLSMLTYSPPSFRKVKVAGSHFVDYTATVDFHVTETMVTPVTQDPTSTVTVNGVSVTSGTASDPIALVVGDNTINTVVTAADGTTKNTYSIVITRQVDASLASLAFNPGLTLHLVSGSHDVDYTATANNSSITVTPTVEDPAATVTVNGTTVTSGTASGPIALTIGDNTINTVVTASDGTTTKTYSTVVTRQPNALLATLTYSPASIKKVKVSGSDYADYTATVANGVNWVSVTPTVQDPTSTVQVNGTTVASGATSDPIALIVGDNTINTVVTAADGTTTNTYSIVITRQIPSVVMAYDPSKEAPIESAQVVVHQNVSPNGDGNSDVLVIEGITNHPDNKLQIMSRSGALVYEAKGYDNGTKAFDGHSSTNGKLQQAGTYFYSLEYKDGNETKYKTGFIVLKY